MYLDEYPIGNSSGSNDGTSTLPIMRTLVGEEPNTGIVSQTAIHPRATLFGDQHIFVSQSQHHWHIFGVPNIDQETK